MPEALNPWIFNHLCKIYDSSRRTRMPIRKEIRRLLAAAHQTVTQAQDFECFSTGAGAMAVAISAGHATVRLGCHASALNWSFSGVCAMWSM
jgi:hypothetical protein